MPPALAWLHYRRLTEDAAGEKRVGAGTESLATGTKPSKMAAEGVSPHGLYLLSP